MIEYYKDLAFPTASLIFCVLGVPVGIVSKRSGRVGGFAVGVLIVVIYYVLNVACEFLVTTLVIPPLAGAWGPNAIFVLVTLWWFYAVGRQ
jgi:lipopolysaccharide export system permease protein